MKLSEVIRAGGAPDPLDAALQSMGVLITEPSDNMCRVRIRELHRVFPHIGASVRQYPSLALKLESLRVLPRIRPFQQAYRQEIHRSLWQVITDLHDFSGWANSDIAEMLDQHGI